MNSTRPQPHHDDLRYIHILSESAPARRCVRLCWLLLFSFPNGTCHRREPFDWKSRLVGRFDSISPRAHKETSEQVQAKPAVPSVSVAARMSPIVTTPSKVSSLSTLAVCSLCTRIWMHYSPSHPASVDRPASICRDQFAASIKRP